MKSKNKSLKSNKVNRHIIECSCGSPTHFLVFDYDKEYEFISVQFTSNFNQSFFKRLKDGIAFIFKKRNFPIGDDVLISTSNVKDLEEFIKDIKKVAK